MTAATRPLARKAVARRMRLALAWLPLGLACPALASGPTPAPVARAAPGAARLEQVRSIIGAARCSADSQCRVLGIGTRPCGGPESHLAWSTVRTDARALEAAARAYAEERQRWHEKSGLMSTCDVRPAPGVACRRQGERARCTLLPRGSAVR